MKKFKFNKISIVILAVAFTLGLGGIIAVRALAPGAINLRTAANFAVLAGSGITDSGTGATTITGDIGSSAISTETGFPGMVTFISGTNHNAANPNDAATVQAKVDLNTAYTDAASIINHPPTTTYGAVKIFGTETLLPGVYNAPTSVAITAANTLTLDGGNDPNAVFIFQAGSTLTLGVGSTVALINGAQACNVFWQVGTSATLDHSTFAGTIMADQSITDSGGSTVLGRFLASTAHVTLSHTTITVPTCASPNLTLIKTRTNDNGGTAAETAWTLDAAGPTHIFGATGDAAVTNAVVTAGDYTLSESISPAGYTASTYSCIKNGAAAVVSNSITLANSDDATCTINNDDIAPILHLRKIISGGTATAADFPLTANGTGANDISGTSPVDSGVGLLADTFALSETNPGGYTASAWVCVGGTQVGSNITLGINEEATCTITNTYIEPSHSSGGGTVYGCKDPNATNYNFFSSSNPELCVYDEPTITIISTPVVVAPIIPKLPKTGFAPQESGLWYESLLNNILNLFR